MSRIRLFFTGFTLFFLVIAGAAWGLSNGGIIIQNSWAPFLGTAFSVLGVLIAFIQWLVPLPSSDPTPSTESAKSSHAREIFRKRIYDELSRGTGAIVIYENKDNKGENISASFNGQYLGANIVERIVKGYPIFAAVFPGLNPGTYGIRSPSYRHEQITVFSGQVSEVDWRQKQLSSYEKEEQEENRQKSQTVLRILLVMIGLGGVLFLIHRYWLMIPNFDTVGIILMNLGVVSMLSSLVLDWLGWFQGDAVYSIRPSVFGVELGGILFLAHRYMSISYLDIIGIILMVLAGIWLIIGIIAVLTVD